MDNGLEKELSDAMENALSEKSLSQPLKAAPMPSQHVQKAEGTLVEQWERMEQIRWELRQRVMNGRLDLENEYRQRRHEIEAQHGRDMLQSQIHLEEKRDQDLKALAEEIRNRLREFESLTNRVG